MKMKSEESSSLTYENNINKKVKKIKTSVDVNKIVDTSNKILKKYKKAFILIEDVDNKPYEKNNKPKTLISKPNVISEIKLHNKKRKKELKLTVENEDNQKSEHKSHKKVKKTISFQDSVEVCLADSDKKVKSKLKEDLTDTTPITNMISEMNSFKKGSIKGKSKKEKKIEKHNEDSKLVQQQCIEYLRKWKNDKNSWKFEKAKQIRLLSYMFDSTKLPDIVFPIFVEYINGSKGNITKVITQKCSVVVKEMEDFMELEEDVQNKKTKPDEKKYERARSILQVVDDINL